MNKSKNKTNIYIENKNTIKRKSMSMGPVCITCFSVIKWGTAVRHFVVGPVGIYSDRKGTKWVKIIVDR